MQHFMIPCQNRADGTKTPYPIYVGEAIEGVHPLEQQDAWLRRELGLEIPLEVMDSFAKLRDIALENNVSFEELAVYAMGEAVEMDEAEAARGEAGGGPDPEE